MIVRRTITTRQRVSWATKKMKKQKKGVHWEKNGDGTLEEDEKVRWKQPWKRTGKREVKGGKKLKEEGKEEKPKQRRRENAGGEQIK